MNTSLAVPIIQEETQLVQQKGRIPELDGLRGIAISMVLIVHFFYLHHQGPDSNKLARAITILTSISWSGVDLFFILSGFLICGLLLDSRESPCYFKTFYARRSARIWPVYFIWMGIAFGGLVAAQAGAWSTVFSDAVPIWSYPLFLQNFFFAKLRLFGPQWFGPTWSLAVEEQFYLLAPLVIKCAPRRCLPWIGLSVVVVCPLTRALVFPANGFARYMLLPCRADSLCLGGLIAYCVRNPKLLQRCREQSRWIWIAAAILFGSTTLLAFKVRNEFMSWMPLKYGFSLLALFYGAVLLTAIVNPPKIWSWLLSTFPLVFLSRISYCLYVIHQGIYAVCERLALPRPPITALAASILFSTASYYVLERKCIRWAHHNFPY
jgi:peptidoglycan/LPS O-acetylase OafA/YrhL